MFEAGNAALAQELEPQIGLQLLIYTPTFPTVRVGIAAGHTVPLQDNPLSLAHRCSAFRRARR